AAEQIAQVQRPGLDGAGDRGRQTVPARPGLAVLLRHQEVGAPEKRRMPVREDYLERPALLALQQERWRALLDEILPRNRFYAHKLAAAGLTAADIASLNDLRRLPFTTKSELLADQEANPPYGSVLTYPLARYCRLHQTSGTSGRPMRWLDTPE